MSSQYLKWVYTSSLNSKLSGLDVSLKSYASLFLFAMSRVRLWIYSKFQLRLFNKYFSTLQWDNVKFGRISFLLAWNMTMKNDRIFKVAFSSVTLFELLKASKYFREVVKKAYLRVFYNEYSSYNSNIVQWISSYNSSFPLIHFIVCK